MLSQCCAAGFVSLSWHLGTAGSWLCGGLGFFAFPSLPWQYSSGWCCSWRSRASHTFPFRSSAQRECGFIFLCPPLHLEDHQHCSPSRDRHGGCVLGDACREVLHLKLYQPIFGDGWMDGSPTFLHGHCHQTPVSGAAILLNRYFKPWLV